MSKLIASNHPKRELLFFVAQDLDDKIRTDIRTFVFQLAGLRNWLLGPPRFVMSRDEPEDTSRGDIPVETVGGCLEIYSNMPPWSLPREIDILHLDEVSSLVQALCDFSRLYNLAIEIELDGELIGAIDVGQIDRSLAEGLLGEWKRRLDVSPDVYRNSSLC